MIDLLLMRKEKGLHDEIYFGSEKPSDQYLGLICDESLTCRCLNSNPGHFGCFTFIFVSFGE
jgi:hypothetical protein